MTDAVIVQVIALSACVSARSRYWRRSDEAPSGWNRPDGNQQQSYSARMKRGGSR